MKKNEESWWGLWVLVFILFTILAFHFVTNQQKPQKTEETQKAEILPSPVTITVTLPIGDEYDSTTKPSLITPGTPPGTLELFGSIIGETQMGDLSCYSPFQDNNGDGRGDCVVDFSHYIFGGRLINEFEITSERYYHLAYRLDGKYRADNITVSIDDNFVTFTSYCTLGYEGDDSYQVISFIVTKDKNEKPQIVKNLKCM